MKDSIEKTTMIKKLFDEHADSLYRYAKYSLPPDIDPRDVVQEVFLRAFRSWDNFKGTSSSKTWLFRIARNYIYDLLRKKRRQRTIMSTNRHYEGSVQLETLIEIEDALAKLQPSYQQVLNLRWLQDMTVAETSQVLEWSKTKVRVTFHRAKKKLEEILSEPMQNELMESKEGETTHEKRQ